MSEQQWIVAYDVADDGRRRRIAALLERAGVRTQWSVFLVVATPRHMSRLLSRLRKLADPRHDCVEAWKVTGVIDGPLPTQFVVW